MAVNYVCDDENKEFVNVIKPMFSKYTRGLNLTLYITDDIKLLPNKEEFNHQIIIITCKCSKEFVNRAVNITDYLLYKCDSELLVNKLKTLLGKSQR